MDEFRKLQKQECANGGKIKNLQEFKKWSRKLAKTRLKQKDRTELDERQEIE
jgi:hypothetical protein